MARLLPKASQEWARPETICLYDEELSLLETRLETSFETRLSGVENRIQSAVNRSGRNRSDVTLVAVSKKFSAEHVKQAYEAGLRIFGENYVQEFADKKPALSGLKDARFHFIGHLQSNKARLACELFDAIHTVDSAKLLKRLATSAAELGRKLQVLIEIKLSGEAAKAGTDAGAMPEILNEARQCGNLEILGLMTMPPWSQDAEASRPYFKKLAQLATRYELKHLSMGMSNDLEVAIEEGATMVRVGTALFGQRPKPAA